MNTSLTPGLSLLLDGVHHSFVVGGLSRLTPPFRQGQGVPVEERRWVFEVRPS